MKSIVLFSLFVLCAFLSNLSCAQPVMDTDGDVLLNGGTYYIMAPTRGLGLAATGNETCPLSVVQTYRELGIPVSISSPLRIRFITVGINLNLRFTAVPTCASTPSKWKIVNGLEEEPVVKITGYTNTESGWFHIERTSDDDFGYNYKLVFCTTNGNNCTDLGSSTDDEGNRLLVLRDDEPLKVNFQKVGSSTS